MQTYIFEAALHCEDCAQEIMEALKREGRMRRTRTIPRIGRNTLADSAHVYGTQGLYLGDDGKLYTHG